MAGLKAENKNFDIFTYRNYPSLFCFLNCSVFKEVVDYILFRIGNRNSGKHKPAIFLCSKLEQTTLTKR